LAGELGATPGAKFNPAAPVVLAAVNNSPPSVPLIVGEVDNNRVVPEPEVEYDEFQAVPLETATPALGYIMDAAEASVQ
jgi:hypothetical protein